MAAADLIDARRILWDDDEPYRLRYEKTATALIAVQRTLQKRRPLRGAEDEFLDLYPRLESADAEVFTCIWEDPFSYFWARRAYELLGLCLKPAETVPYDLTNYCLAIGAANPQAAFALHLDQFKRFIIALNALTGASLRFAQPLQTDLPLSIPGTAFSLLGAGGLEILATSGTTLDARWGGQTVRLTPGARPLGPRAPRMVERPSVKIGAAAVRLKPETFFLPGLRQTEAQRAVPEEFQQQEMPLLDRALQLLARHQPDTLRRLGELIKVIALKPQPSGDYSNVSFSDLPGAFILSTIQNPYWIADSLIHEFFHNRMFFITDDQPVFAQDEPDQDADEPGAFYSPWRTDLRPLSGLLHALYVYIGVCKFWFSVWQSEETTGPHREYAQDQALRWIAALKIGARQLREHARFTEFGQRLFAAMDAEVESLWSASAGLGLSPDAPAMLLRPTGEVVIGGNDIDGRPLSILATIRRHQARYDRQGQRADLDSILKF